MLKPADLRKAITAALPDLGRNPDRLLVFIDEGSVRSTAAASLSFEYGYTLSVIVTDFADHADALIVPILEWIARNQPELLSNPDRARDGFTFEADLLDHKHMDVHIRLALPERVTVADNPDGSRTATHQPEPPLDPHESVETWELILRHPDGTQEVID